MDKKIFLICLFLGSMIGTIGFGEIIINSNISNEPLSSFVYIIYIILIIIAIIVNIISLIFIFIILFKKNK